MTVPQNWPELLAQISDFRLLIDKHDDFSSLAPKVHQNGSLLRTPAPESLIALAEKRLGVRFPPSYRQFLSHSNGMEVLGDATFPGQLWAVEDVRTLREQDGQLIDIVAEFHSPEEMKPMESALAISDHGDACDLFLCPELTRSDGEMECWTWASWTPGETRYATFEAWLIHEWKRAWLDCHSIRRFGDTDFHNIANVFSEANFHWILEKLRAEIVSDDDSLFLIPGLLRGLGHQPINEFLDKRLQEMETLFWQSDQQWDNVTQGSFDSLLPALEAARDKGRNILGELKVKGHLWAI